MNSFDKKVLDKIAKDFSDGKELIWKKYKKGFLFSNSIEFAVELARLEFEKKIEEMWQTENDAEALLTIRKLRCFLQEKEEGEKQNGQKR